MVDVDATSTSKQQLSNTIRNAVIACGQCSRSFIKRRDYNRHCKTHNRPHQCRLCPKSFALKTDLERHGSNHENSRATFRCIWPGCKHEGSVRKDNLLKHMKRSHLHKDGLDENEEERQERKKELMRLYKKSTENEKIVASHRARKLGLFEVIKDGNEDALKQVLDSFANLQSVGQPEAEIFSEALLWAAKNGNTSATAVLLAKGVPVDVKNRLGQTPMYIAAKHGHINNIQQLVKHSVDINDQLKSWTPLSLAVENGHKALVQYLLDEGTSVNVATNSLGEALCAAAENGHEDIVILLLKNGADIEQKEVFGRTPLQNAVIGGHVEIVKLLLAKGAQIEATNDYGWTPLIIAVHCGKDAVVSLLLKHGASLDAKDDKNMGPLDYAANSGNVSTVRLLLQWALQVRDGTHVTL